MIYCMRTESKEGSPVPSRNFFSSEDWEKGKDKRMCLIEKSQKNVDSGLCADDRAGLYGLLDVGSEASG